MSALKSDIRDHVLKEGLTPEFTAIGELVEAAVKFDNAKRYTTGYNNNQGSSNPHRTNATDHNRGHQVATHLKSSHGANARQPSQHKPGNNPFQACQMTQLSSARGGNVNTKHPMHNKNPVNQGNNVNKPPQSNPNRNANQANNTIVCFNCNQTGHIRPNCPFPDKDRRVAGARIEETIQEDEEDQIEEFDQDAPHPEEQQEWDSPYEMEDNPYHFNDEYETKSVDDDIIHVNAIIKNDSFNELCRLFEIRVSEAEPDVRVSAVVETGKEQPVYNHRARKKA